jgi:predicted nucleic-acid-binding Zn-ribbon protein
MGWIDMVFLESLTENFQCCKCRNRTCVTRESTISKGGGLFNEILGRGGTRRSAGEESSANPGDKFVFLICGLCGYTEIYSLAVLEHSKESKTVKVSTKENPATLKITSEPPGAG